ncbi:hypothetical protein Rhopal_003722-T1 [Rhodotorula paludigena]|uniref:Ras-GAP domain-containing protein n=1 Tax=Rhodotorula paludigena TaxID=86838 RepID=A0AAV5GKG1_9BASI|nr:hypothetical protein Rhopal_003722-T1 [Rhodotorula paludigena]
MLDRMEYRDRVPSPNPPTSAFPSRPGSSSSRLSNKSSSRSLQSLHSSHATPGSSYDSRAGRGMFPLSGIDPRSSLDDNDTTPSVSQGEWSTQPRRAFSSSRSTTPNSGRNAPRDDTDSEYSYQSRLARAGDDSSLHRSTLAGSVSRPSSPRVRPRTAPSPTPTVERTGSPLRLLPRSPLNDRAPLEDLTFFREVGALAEEARWAETSGSTPGADVGDSDSIRSGHSSVLSGASAPRTSSLRALRLREDIEKEALRIRERASMEEMRKNAAAASAVVAGHRAVTPEPPRPPTGEDELREPSSTMPPLGESSPAAAHLPPRKSFSGSMSGIPLFPGAPVPASPAINDDTQSVRSFGTGSGSTSWATPRTRNGDVVPGASNASVLSASGSVASGLGAARTEYGARASERPRQRESREWSQTCWVWVREKPSGGTGSGGGKFSKAPLIRDVPAALKRKSGKRESAHHLLSPAEALLFGVEDEKRSKSSSKDKGKDRDKGLGPAAASRDGRWRRATGVLRDDGQFRIFGDSDKAVVHAVHLPSLNRSDIRIVDHSLFGRPNCISISRHSTSPSTPHRQSFSPSQPPLPAKPDETVYLCFPSVVATQVWLVMAHCFAQPEFYLTPGAATPRLARTAAPYGSLPSDSGTESEDGLRPDEQDSSCRIYRSLQLSINEGRALGELATEVFRPGPKMSWERPAQDQAGDGLGSTDSYSLAGGSEASPVKSSASLGISRLQSRATNDTRDDGSGTSEAFCEIEMGGEVVAQTSVRKGSSPFWNETFVFTDLPPFVAPVTIRVLQASKHSARPHLIGSATVRIPDLPRQKLVEDWWAVKPATAAKSSDVVGELSLSMRINEEVVLPSRDYQAMLDLLTDDADADLATDVAHEFPSDLEEVTKLLMRIYQAESILLPRILRLADIEVDNNARSQRSAAILFRGNTILTKSVELYLRLIGAEYLDASIGEPIRRICAEKVEIEIDPMKLKPGTKDKELQANVHALHEWTLTLWNSIYDARENDLRQIFGHIQRVVVDKYGQGEDQKNTRWTCVSAFIFLRFFVPAVLNPKLFFIVSGPPDPKSQRTLTLVAKTLQGLANFSSFGQKEPWMLPMNPFVQENTAALVDFIEHVATPAPSTAYRQEWTSTNASAYVTPYRLRSSLPGLAREGVPILPHLIDLPRELGLLATRVARLSVEKGPIVETASASAHDGRDSPSIASSRGGRTRRFVDFADACIDAHVESRRRGGGLVSLPHYEDVRNRMPDPKTRTKRSLVGRPATSSGAPPTAGLRKSFGMPAPIRTASSGTDELHIRNPTPTTATMPRHPMQPPQTEIVDDFSPVPHFRQDSVEGGSSASRRNHRSFTINGSGIGAGLARQGSYPPRSFSNEDLSKLASIQTSEASDFEREREQAISPLPTSQTLASLSSYPVYAPERNSLDEEEADEAAGAATAAYPTYLSSRSSDKSSPVEEYSFPPAKSRTIVRGPPTSTSKGSTGSTGRSGQVPPPIATGAAPVTTSRIRITQETTTTTTYVTDPAAASMADPAESPSTYDEDFSLSPTSHEDGTPYESSFGASAFSAPLMRAQASQTSTHSVMSVLSGRSLASSASNMSISAEVSAAAGAPHLGAVAGRRASSAGITLGGFGRRTGGSAGVGGAGAASPRDDESDAGSSSKGSSGKASGLLSRAMGRKGSRAS